jgi:hypothetical protein
MVFPDKTLYSAHEIAQMVPLFGLDVYHLLRKQNDWMLSFLPNAQGMPFQDKPYMTPSTADPAHAWVGAVLKRTFHISGALGDGSKNPATTQEQGSSPSRICCRYLQGSCPSTPGTDPGRPEGTTEPLTARI